MWIYAEERVRGRGVGEGGWRGGVLGSLAFGLSWAMLYLSIYVGVVDVRRALLGCISVLSMDSGSSAL